MPRKPKDTWPSERELIRKRAAKRRGEPYRAPPVGPGRPPQRDRVTLHICAELVAALRDTWLPVRSAGGRSTNRPPRGASEVVARVLDLSYEEVRATWNLNSLPRDAIEIAARRANGRHTNGSSRDAFEVAAHVLRMNPKETHKAWESNRLPRDAIEAAAQILGTSHKSIREAWESNRLPRDAIEAAARVLGLSYETVRETWEQVGPLYPSPQHRA